MSVSAKFFQKFRNLIPDAQPRVPVDSEGVTSPSAPNDSFPPRSRTVDSLDYQHEDDCKKPKVENKDKKPKAPPPSSPPIHTQAQGNVIHVINSNGVHFGTNITNYMNTPSPLCQPNNGNHESHEEIVAMTPAIDNVMVSDKVSNHIHLDCVSRNMSRGWRGFFRSVGYTKGHVDTVLETEGGDVRETRYLLLLDWKQTTDQNTLGALASALWRCGERVVVRELAAMDS